MRGTLLFCRIWSWACRLFLEQTEAHPPFLHACLRSSKSSSPHLSFFIHKTWTWVQSSKVLSFRPIPSYLIVKWQMQKQLGSAGGKKSSLLLLLSSLLFLQRLEIPVAGVLNSSGLITCHPTIRNKTSRKKYDQEIYSHKICKLFLLLLLLLLLQSHGS